jgi:N-methylhydantoinase A
VWNAECGIDRAEFDPGHKRWRSTRVRSIPHSAFRIPHWGGEGGGGVVRVGVDVGGTFTDLVALGADGAIEVRKVVTTPHDPTVGLFHAIDVLPIDVLIHGTTIATNALLERRGARVALVTTQGFEDLLWLRRQDRAALYDLARDHPLPLVARADVVGVAERAGPTGALEPLTDGEVARVVARVRALAPPPEALAVALLFAFRHAEHERRLVAALRDALPNLPIAASHEVLPVFREFERASTTTVEAYLRPRVAAYLGRLERDVRASGRSA